MYNYIINMIDIVLKARKKPRQSLEFYNWAHQEINESLNKWLGVGESENIELKAIDGGIMSIVYEVVSPLNLNMMIKIQDQETPYNDILAEFVCKELNIHTPRIYYHSVVQRNKNFYVIEVLEKIKFPLLSDYFSKTEDHSAIRKLGENIRILNSRGTKGFGIFRSASLSGEFGSPKKFLIKTFFTKEIIRSNIQNGNFNKQEIRTLKKKIKTFKFGTKSYFSHGDIHLDNCFYDSSNGSVYLFDFHPKAAPLMYDVAYFKLKSLARGRKDIWESFIQGYGKENVNDAELNLLSVLMSFRKCEQWFNEKDSNKFHWVYKEVKKYIS